MESGSSTLSSVPVGLRERKKLRTRETIARVALELFAEHGFHDTTIKQIADAADVSPRTVSGYFPTKEELVFPEHGALFDALEVRLREREPDETAMEALRAWIGSLLDGDEHDLRKRRCRRLVVESDNGLRAYERGIQERAEQIIATAVAVDLDLPADDLVPRMVGAATMAAMEAMGRDHQHAEAEPADHDTEEFRTAALAMLDQAFAFLGAGVQGLRRRRR
jgi:AcrR family transcriptional regulator